MRPGHILTSPAPQKHTAAADITSSLSENQVPEAFLFMMLFQFSTMVIDRALYLRKTVLGKLIFQVTLVFGIHVWMFFILPYVTERYVPKIPRHSAALAWHLGVPEPTGWPRQVAEGWHVPPTGCSAKTRWPSCGTL